MFDAASLKQVGLDPATLYPVVLPRPPAKTPDSKAPPRPMSFWSWFFSISPPVHESTAVAPEQDGGSPQSPGRSDFSRTDSGGVTHVDVHGPQGEVLEGTEEEEDLKDILQPDYDQLRLKWGWWVLEVVPLRHRYQTKDNQWRNWFG
jgi:hypothetical protein